MSLLDDVSIVVTPNGYKAGELYAVIPVPSEGAELVPSVASIVNAGGGTITQISGNSYSSTSDGTSGSAVRPKFDLSTTAGKRYKLTITPTGTISGTVNFDFYDGSSYLFQNYDFTTTKEIYFIDNGSVFGAFDGTQTYNISSFTVSVKEYTSADMDVTRATAATRVDEDGLVNYAEIVSDTELVTNGDFASDLTGWTGYGTRSATGGIATIGASANSGIYQGVLTQGVRYTVTVNVTSYDGVGTAQFINDNGANLYTITAIGIQTFTFIHTISSSNLILRGVSNALFSLSSVSVKEVTRDNVPRIDYTGGGCPHILAEPQRTNLIAYSEDFSDSSWSLDGSNVNLTRTPNATTSPSGEENATKLIGNNISNDPNNSYIGVNTSAAAPYTTSIFAKKGEYDYLVSGIGSYAGGYYAIFNLSNGTVSTSPTASGTTASIEDYGNGWYRCLVNTTNTGGGELLFISPSVDGTLTTNYTNTTNGIYVWGGQVENGSYPTSYIPTSGSTVTRNQDQFTRDGIGSLINSTEGVLFVEMAAFSNDGTNRTIALSDGTGNNLVRLYFSNSSNRIVSQVKVGGSTQVTFDITGITVIDFNKVALKYKENDFSIWINGVERGTDTSGTTPTSMNRLALDNGSGSENLFGKVKQLQVYTTALTDTQLAALTS